MALNRGRQKNSVLGLYLIGGLALGVWLLMHRPATADASVAPNHALSHAWTFTAEQFNAGVGGYFSPEMRAPLPFTAAAIRFSPGGFASAAVGVDVRLRADGGVWSPWYSVEGFEQEADGSYYGENLVAWPQAREAQVRLRSFVQVSEAIQDLSVITIDASEGPTAAQAVRSATSRKAVNGVLALANSGVPQPLVISRSDWGANEGWMTWSPYYVPVEKVMVHHTVSGGGTDPAAEVRAIYYYHAVTRGWGDIGYNFLVDRFGNVYEGRYGGPDVVGAHVGWWNDGSLGVSVLGCYDNGACSPPHVPTTDTKNAIADLIAWAANRRTFDPRELREFTNGYSTVTNYVLSGHRDYGSTVCPGGILYAELPNLRQMVWDRLPDYDVRFGWHDTPASMDGGQQVTVHIDLSNYGRLAWADGQGVRLGYRWLKDSQVVAENTDAARINVGSAVPFGETTALVAQLTSPPSSGTYTLRWDLYRDGVGWFANQPAPAGRSQPLDQTVELAYVLLLDMQVSPSSVEAGAPVHLNVSVQGDVGRAFETRTRLPEGVRYVVGSGTTDLGILTLESDEVVWTGTLNGPTANAGFDVLVSADLVDPAPMPLATTLSFAGHSSTAVLRWFFVNGIEYYLPLIDRSQGR